MEEYLVVTKVTLEVKKRVRALDEYSASDKVFDDIHKEVNDSLPDDYQVADMEEDYVEKVY